MWRRNDGDEPIMTVLGKHDPRGDDGPSRMLGWWAAAGAVVCLLAALAARRSGASEVAVGVWLATSVPAVFAWLANAWAPGGRLRRAWKAPIITATYFASAATALASIVPGLELGQATLVRPGDELVVALPEGGTTRIAVSGAMPGEHPGYVAYELRAGDERMLGAMERTIAHIPMDQAVKHRRVEHGADVHTVRLPAGRTRIVLVHLGGELVGGLRIAVFDPLVPTWVPASLAVLAFIAVTWHLATGRAAASVAMAAGVCVGFGLAMNAMATPLRPFRGSVLALGAAVPLGTVGGVLGLALLGQVKRAWERFRHRARRSRGRSS